MGGTVHGIANLLACPNGHTAANRQRNIFAAVNSFFEHLSTPAGGNYMEPVAGYFGEGGATGYDATGGANPSGENAFRVFKQKTSAARPGGGSQLGAIYWLFQWADVSYWNVCELLSNNGYDGVGIISAFLEDGNSPWNGSTADDGTDTHGLPVWADNGSTAHVLEYSNYSGHNTNKNNLMTLYYDASGISTEVYAQMIADADNVIILISSAWGDAGNEHDMVLGAFQGLIDKLTAVPSYPYPVLAGSMYDVSDTPGRQFYLGYPSRSVRTNSQQWPAGGTGSAQPMGGIVTPTNGNGTFRWYDLEFVINGNQPNGWLSDKYEESPIGICVSVDRVGWLDDFFRSTYDIANNSWDATNERAVFGANTSPTVKLSVPWPSTIGEAPAATRTQAGVPF